MKEKCINYLNSDKCQKLFTDFYGQDRKLLKEQKERYLKLIESFSHMYKADSFCLFSTPGRAEIIGNHTDHNMGKVTAAGITLDSIAAAAPTGDNRISIYSSYYKKEFKVDLRNLSPVQAEAGTTESLIRGTASFLKQRGYKIGGFKAFLDSNVLPGSGLSSSACFEVILGTILNALYNENLVTPLEIAKTGQSAENIFMQKPCGLMDQVACAYGGIVAIDFKEKESPVINKLNFDFSKTGFSILIVDTKASHENLTPAYAAIPLEMKSVARVFEKNTLREISLDELLANIPGTRNKTGDRAVLRALHYLKENERVSCLVKCLSKKDFTGFLNIVNQSGNSSWKLLQNCYPPDVPSEQAVTIALALTEHFISEIKTGACRVHGGGFAGTILAFIPENRVSSYSGYMENVFGSGTVKKLGIRQNGTMQIELK